MVSSAKSTEIFGSEAQRRVGHWTLALGAIAAVAALRWQGWGAAGAVALGSGLAWLNYRWLKQAVGSIVTASGPSQGSCSRVPRVAYLKLFSRYALIAVALYVILARFHWSAAAFLCGLFTLVAAVMGEAVCELVRNVTRVG